MPQKKTNFRRFFIEEIKNTIIEYNFFVIQITN